MQGTQVAAVIQKQVEGQRTDRSRVAKGLDASGDDGMLEQRKGLIPSDALQIGSEAAEFLNRVVLLGSLPLSILGCVDYVAVYNPPDEIAELEFFPMYIDTGK